MDLSAIALQGLQQAETSLTDAASGIAWFGAGSSDGPGVDTVDLSEEVVALMSAKNQFSFNLKTLKTANEIQQSLIDLIA